MNDLEFCIATRRREAPVFARVLRAMPQDRLDHKPEPRSRSAAELAWTMVLEEVSLVELLDTGTIQWPSAKAPATVEELAVAYEKNAALVTARLEKLDEAGWRKGGRFHMGGDNYWEQTVAEFVWLFLFDAIHHRGQLSTYLRPMGGKVPSIYGPSADDSGQG
jgi:uncharacterized damage-inducible protein DinB